MVGDSMPEKLAAEIQSCDSEVNIPPEDPLRAIPLGEVESDAEALPALPVQVPEHDAGAGSASVASFAIDPTGEPQARGTKIYATDLRSGQRFYVGQVTWYPKVSARYIGLSRLSDAKIYDRAAVASRFGDWAHFIWPTVMGESGGREIVINAWDRACFTWGFYQLAAHTPNDNLILLMRALVKLSSAAIFFPDLKLDDGKLARIVPSGIVSLERTKTVPVGSGTEEQLVDFMAYLNPSPKRFDDVEAVTCAKFITWASEDPEMLATTTRVSIDIMKSKLKAIAAGLGLVGKRPELAIWVSDITHHGRGTTQMIKAALAKPTFDSQLAALGQIDKYGTFGERLATVKAAIDRLIAEGRFTHAALGSGGLVL